MRNDSVEIKYPGNMKFDNDSICNFFVSFLTVFSGTIHNSV